MNIAQTIAESAMEATMSSAKYWNNKDEYISAINRCNADDMQIYAEMVGIDSPSTEDIENALTIYHSKHSVDRMVEVY